MQLVLIRKKEIKKKVLPQKISGQHQIYLDDQGSTSPLLSVSAYKGRWIIKENNKIEFLDGVSYDSSGHREIILKENDFYPFVHKQSGEKMIILVEPIGRGRGEFIAYNVPSDGVIKIGYSKDNHICFRDDLLSETIGATINYTPDGRITIKDNDSINGTYLNGKSIVCCEAKYGDELYLAGLRVILGRGFVSVNDPDGNVYVALSKRQGPVYTPGEEDDEYSEEKNTFSSAPRYKRTVTTKKVRIENPPNHEDKENMPWAVVMGPSITMAFGSVFSSVFTVQNVMQSNGDISSALPTLVMSVCMVLGTIIWPVFAKRFEKRARKAKEQREKREYLSFLDRLRNDINDEIKRQETIKRENNPSIDECISRIKEEKMTLWERSPVHDDFLEVMIGTGDVPMDIDIEFTEKSAIEKVSETYDAMYELAYAERNLKNVPVTIPFSDNSIVGLIGDRDRVISIAKALLIELTALHNYDDLKIIFIYNEAERKIWDFVKWIPHVWNNDKTVRYIANDVDEAKELSNIISNIRAVNENNKSNSESTTHYVIVAADRVLAEKIQALKEFVQNPSIADNISVLALYDERKYLPKSCSTICSVEEGGVYISDYNSITDEPQLIKEAVVYDKDPEDIFVKMANIELDIVSASKMLPTSLTYLDMFEAGKPEHLDVLTLWEESDSVRTLAAPIGIDADGYPIKLDIHEKAHGPHGLIAGMTGSGKSEFIISYIAALSCYYSPEEIAFVLIDFKGGGMADVFKKLPHLAGSITNLDGNELQRSFIAIESELEKRQTLFKEISEKKKISNIDIYKYQKLRREDKSLNPLPHLIIISDEFAELKQQHSDFMEQLIRIARIGRSLGVHLILATQKPDGVVDDQIKSNIKFKICLKVQDKADSQSVIGRPDATLITNAGRFYLQVGYNEIFEYGQSPWSGAPYYPADQYQGKKDKQIYVLSEQGRVIYTITPPRPPRPSDVPEKQIDALVEHLSNLANDKGCVCEKLWLEPLASYEEKDRKNLQGESLEDSSFVLNPYVGMYDDLKNRRHIPLTVPLTETGNAAVFGIAGSGMLDFLNRFVYSLLEKHTPEEVNLYAIDCDTGALAAFSEAPHFRSVALLGELEKYSDIVDELLNELAERKELFRRYGGDYQNYVKNSGSTVPNLVLIIDNFGVFREEFYGGCDNVIKLVREGKKYGIFVLVTSMGTDGMGYTTRQFFGNVYCLQQNNQDGYFDIIGRTGGIYPAKNKGRGIFKKDDSVYEFQVDAIFTDRDNVYEAVEEFCRDKITEYGILDNKLKSLPEIVLPEYFEELGYEIKLRKMPVGIDQRSKEVICLDLGAEKITAFVYDNENRSCADAFYDMLAATGEIRYVITPDAAEDVISKCIEEIESIVSDRAGEGLAALNRGDPLPDFEHVYTVVRDYYKLLEMLSSEDIGRLNELIVGITNNYHIHFILIDDVESFYEVEAKENLGNALPFVNGVNVDSGHRGAKYFKDWENFAEPCEKMYGTVVIDDVRRSGKIVAKEEKIK